MESAGPLLSGRISDIAQILGEPNRQHDDGGATHRCRWTCGCEALNARGLCFEDGWSVVPCPRHLGHSVQDVPSPA